MLALCRSLPGRPTVFEALWDGDTTGWFLELWLTTESPRARTRVASLRYGSDVRLFTGRVPPWPEAVVAGRVGEQLARTHGCALWVPSPDTPDCDAPRYDQRDKAAQCEDCSKWFLPAATDDQGVCSECRPERDAKARLTRPPTDSTRQRGNWFVFEETRDGERSTRVRFSSTSSATLFRKLLHRAAPDLDLDEDSVVERSAVAQLQRLVLRELDVRLQRYEPDPRTMLPSRTVRWADTDYVLTLAMNREHREIDELLSLTTTAEADERAIRIFTNRGIKTRDVVILQHLQNRERPASRSIVTAEHSGLFGSVAAVEASLARLLHTGCIVDDGGAFALTQKGALVNISEEGA